MPRLGVYLPQDRLRSLTTRNPHPDRVTGAVVFADISGFTPLAEALSSALGARRGAEELARHLDAVFTPLIAEVERYGGSVIGFAGDSITCWFDQADGLATARAAACGFALQHVMGEFTAILLPSGKSTALRLKVSIANGAARRLVVGDPADRYIDTLAGTTVTRSAIGELLAEQGDIIADEPTVLALAEAVTIREWRVDQSTGERFAVLESYANRIAHYRLPPSHNVADDQIRDWLNKVLLERPETFLTEFRPCAAVFVRFIGIDYEADEAGNQLDQFVHLMQTLSGRYDATLLNLTIGDKGSYAFISLGAMHKHEDDARRAVTLALELRASAAELSFLQPVQIGVTMGTMLVGAYGGATRRTFDPLGTDVNLSARLMQAAAPGEVLISGRVHSATRDSFTFEPHVPLPLKGHADPMPVFAVTGERLQRAIRLQEPPYALPIVGRQTELQTITGKLELVLTGQAQVIGIVAEAGMGKSRLVAEVIRAARRMGFGAYGGTCQSDSVNTPYHVWKSVWQAFFDVDPAAPPRKQLRHLEGEISVLAPERLPALPLLSTLLNLNIPDNDFTRTLEPKYRQSVLHALLEECWRAAGDDEPLLIVLEDLHWIDALSNELLETLARTLSDAPICFVLAYRPPKLARLAAPRVEALRHFTRIELPELSGAEAAQAILAKLAQLFPARAGPVPDEVLQRLIALAQGNPFYLEELLNYLRDRGIDPRDRHALDHIEVPDSLHALILSRIDQLTEREKTTLRAASIVGRLFSTTWLTGYYPELGDESAVKPQLDQLQSLDITLLATPEPELAYLFKHIVTHEVTYESLPFATRSQLHEQLGAYLEAQVVAGTLSEASVLNALAHHYSQSGNDTKHRYYLRKAASAARSVSAFASALDYLMRLLDLIPTNDPEHSALALEVAEVQFVLGDFASVREAVQEAQATAASAAERAATFPLLAQLLSQDGDHDGAKILLAEAIPLARSSGDQFMLCRALYALGDLYWRSGEMAEARAVLEECLSLARDAEDSGSEISALLRLGTVYQLSNLAAAETLLAEGQARAADVGNRERLMTALNNLGVIKYRQEQYELALNYYKEALSFARELGTQYAASLQLSNLALCEMHLGRYTTARERLREGLALARRLDSTRLILYSIANFAELAYSEGQTHRALALFELSRRHPAADTDFQQEMERVLMQWGLEQAEVELGLAAGTCLDWDATIDELLTT